MRFFAKNNFYFFTKGDILVERKKVEEALEIIIKDIAKLTDKRYDDEIKYWLVAATLRIWAGNELCAEEYIKAVAAFNGTEYTIAQFMTALECAGEKDRKLEVPEFFKSIVKRDIDNRTNESRNMADCIGRFLAMMALINGDFTLEEAEALKEISDTLLEYCDRKGVVPGKEREHKPEMITEKNATGYYAKPEKSKKESEKSEVKNPAKENNDSGVITINLNLSPEIPNIQEDKRNFTKVSDPKKEKTESGKEETLESVLAELNSLVGLEKVKNDVQSLMNFIRICRMRDERGMKVPKISYHLVFTGNPGTGKTTVARLVAKLYYLMGILPQGQLVETDRSGLVGGYLGQTAIKTQEVIQSALGGVLFIDEAYSLANDKDDSYGKEAIETILKAMEDHRDELVVIVAGYDNLMHKFIDSNPGLRSRFNKYFHFPDYNGEELLKIFERFCNTNGYILSDEAVPYLKEKMEEAFEHREEHFGNARAVRNLFEHAINHQANRLVLEVEITDEKLAEITVADIEPALEVM